MKTETKLNAQSIRGKYDVFNLVSEAVKAVYNKVILCEFENVHL
jgi:hypothetical protein